MTQLSSNKPVQPASQAGGNLGEASGAARVEVADDSGRYTVVARRYRPKTFEELVGQDTVAHALVRAIESHRVGHAYLFTGARGVGKTSTARIFAKALNASTGTLGHFDPASDVATAIDAGEDMDVIEIDGASNRGIDEIRQLRSNASIRPTRSPYKIYIIDEVHMLTPPAFNALLKTLEEPPGHVKFIFCTTDPEKIPITVLSRCQRFDFPPVQTEQILGRLRFICESEGTQADDAALRVIARRAAGSMRDSQSLLEQLLSFGGDRVTVDDVHAMLGTADEARLASFASRLIQRDAAGALVELDAAIHAGVDAGQLAEQLLGYLRDMMTVAVGGPADLMRTASVSSLDQLREWGKAWGTMTLLSALQLLDETIVRMKHSVQSRILLEVALVQICSLQDLQALADVVKAFAQNQPPSSRTNPSTRVPQVPIAPIAPASISAATSVNATVEASRLSSIPSGSNRAAAGASAVDRPVGQSSPTLNDDTSKKKDEVSTFASLRMNGATTADSLDSADYAHSPKRTGPAVAIATSSGGVLDSDTESKDAAPEKIDSQESARSQNRAVTIDGVGPNDVSNSALLETFQIAASKLEGLVQQSASMAIGVVVLSERRWRVKLSKEGAYALSYFRTAENSRRLLHALREQVGHELELEFEITEVPSTQESNAAVSIPTASTVPTVPQSQMIRQAMLDPLIKRFMDTFDGQVIRVDPPAATVPPMKSVMPISQST